MFTVNIKNFRSFKDQTFKFSKFNILIGENSSGKSSLLKFLLALKQTQQPPSSRLSNFIFKGIYADLGSYKDSVYYQDDSLPIEFSFEFDQNYHLYFTRLLTTGFKTSEERNLLMQRIRKYVGKNILSPTTVQYSITNELSKHETIGTSFFNQDIGRLWIYQNPSKKGQNLLLKNSCNLEFVEPSSGKSYLFNEVSYDKEGFMTLLVSNSLRDSIITTLQQQTNESLDQDVVDSIWYKIAFLVISQNYLNYFINKIQYINPIHIHPERVFLYQDKRNNESINDLKDVVDFFTNSEEGNKDIQNEYTEILKKFGIADEIEIIHDQRLPVQELRVKVKDLVSNIYDVGYGVALQLPIILKALLAERLPERKNSIIFIEQPEVHLHPRLHAQLLTILLSLSKNTVYFIETHSEHIIRKLQVDVKNGSYGTKPEDVTINYLRRMNLQTEVTEHKIQESGKLAPGFPDGFFDNSYNLVKELLD